MNNPPTDRPRALHFLEAADFVRDAHFRDGLSVLEIGAALRHTADAADPMVGGLARDGFGVDEIATMLAEPAVPAGLPAVPPTTTNRDRIADVIRSFPFDNFGLDDVSYLLEAEPDAQEWVPKLAAAILAALPACSDPIECSHEAALGQAEERLEAVHALGTAWSRPSMSAPTRVAGEHLLRLLDTEPAASAGVQTDTAPEPQRSRTARFLDAVTHSGPGYDLIPDAGVQTDEETSR